MNTDYYNQIIDIAKESLVNKRQDWEYYEELLKYTPTGSEFKDAPKTYEDFKTILPIGRYRKSHLVGMIQLVGKYEKVTRKDTYNPIFISTTSQSMLDMYGNKMNVSRALKLAADIYLIEKVNPKYRFNANKYSYPQIYIWNKKVQQWIKQVCKEEGIEDELKKNVIDKDKERSITSNTLGNTYENSSIYRVGKSLNLPNLSDEDVHTKLYETYPFLKKYESLADEDNLSLPPSERIKARPNIKRNKENTLIKSIGYRMTSGIVSLKEHENEHKDYNGVWRKEYLNEVFPNGYYEYDVKSSIYRITYWLNFGVWLDNGIDLYSEIYGSDFTSEEDRRAFKQFCMSLYFDKPSLIYAHKRNTIPNSIGKYGVNGIKNIIDRASRLMFKAIGKSYGSEVFVYESCLYMNVVHKMRKQGVKVVQIYDGFYFDKKKDVDSIIRECVKELKEDKERSNTSNTLGNTKTQGWLNNTNILVDDEFAKELIEQRMWKEEEEIERSITSNTLGNTKLIYTPTYLTEDEFNAFVLDVIGTYSY